MISKFEDLRGQTIIAISGVKIDSDTVTLELNNGEKYQLNHYQNCCESVSIAEIHGDINDILNTPILLAVESTNDTDKPAVHTESYTWTFYRLITHKGNLVLRWLGRSNGYYSESVSFTELKG